MFEVHVTVSCPDLLAAAQLLSRSAAHPASADPVALLQTAQANPTPVAVPSTSPVPVTTAPAPTPFNQTVPLAQAPSFTQADIAKAGADLFTARPDLQPQVMALLSQYGCQSVMDLKPEHFGAFATALRGMGAKI